MTVDSDEDVRSRAERGRNMGGTRVLVCLRTGGVLADEGTDASEVRRVWSTREEFGRNHQGVTEYHLGCRDVGAFFGCSAKSKEDPGQVRDPVGISAAGDESSFQGAMHAFDETIGFRVVGSGGVMC